MTKKTRISVALDESELRFVKNLSKPQSKSLSSTIRQLIANAMTRPGTEDENAVNPRSPGKYAAEIEAEFKTTGIPPKEI